MTNNLYHGSPDTAIRPSEFLEPMSPPNPAMIANKCKNGMYLFASQLEAYSAAYAISKCQLNSNRNLLLAASVVRIGNEEVVWAVCTRPNEGLQHAVAGTVYTLEADTFEQVLDYEFVSREPKKILATKSIKSLGQLSEMGLLLFMVDEPGKFYEKHKALKSAKLVESFSGMMEAGILKPENIQRWPEKWGLFLNKLAQYSKL